MSLEEKLRAYAAKGELVHLSVVFSNGIYHARFAYASPGSGYASGGATDPVEAIEKALKAAPIKAPRVSKPHGEVLDEMDNERAGRPPRALNSEWTNP